MSVKIVTFEPLNNITASTTELFFECLTSYDHKKLCENSYFVKSELSAVEIYQALSVIIGDYHDLFVGEIAGEASWQQEEEICYWLDSKL